MRAASSVADTRWGWRLTGRRGRADPLTGCPSALLAATAAPWIEVRRGCVIRMTRWAGRGRRECRCARAWWRLPAGRFGLGREFVDLDGVLDGYETVIGYSVTPTVGFIRPGFALMLDAFEVSEAFEVPLAFFLDEAARLLLRRGRGRKHRGWRGASPGRCRAGRRRLRTRRDDRGARGAVGMGAVGGRDAQIEPQPPAGAGSLPSSTSSPS